MKDLSRIKSNYFCEDIENSPIYRGGGGRGREGEVDPCILVLVHHYYIRTVMYIAFIMVPNGDDNLYLMHRKTYTSRTYTLLRIKSVLNNTFTLLHKKFDFSSKWRGFDLFNPLRVSTKYCIPSWLNIDLNIFN